jgi:hypothetical protein
MMKKTNQSNLNNLKKAVEQLHKCRASHIEDVIVLEKFGADTVWEGIVSVFEIKGHNKVDKCYAWSSPIEGSTKRRFYAVLKIPPVDSPEKAIRASIIQEFKHKKGDGNAI